jgi:SPP1 family predicted phage head-tail adaptor
MISEFNRRITINHYTHSQDAAGGDIMQLPPDAHDIWAKVEPTSGNKSLDNAQLSYSKSFRITIRSEQSRPVYNEDEIIYLGDKLTIQSITRQNEGHVNFLLINAYATNEQTIT